MYILICEHCGRLLIKPRLKRKGVSKFNYCNKHRKQLDRYGKFLDNNQLFKNDKNRIILHENYAEVELRNRYGEINGIALILYRNLFFFDFTKFTYPKLPFPRSLILSRSFKVKESSSK